MKLNKSNNNSIKQALYTLFIVLHDTELFQSKLYHIKILRRPLSLLRVLHLAIILSFIILKNYSLVSFEKPFIFNNGSTGCRGIVSIGELPAGELSPGNWLPKN